MLTVSSKRIFLSIIVALGLFHIVTLTQIPLVHIYEGWYADSSYAYYKFGIFDDTMFPDLVAFRNGSFGQGKLRYLLQAFSFDLLGFGLYQARFPMLLGGLLAAYIVYITSRLLFGAKAGLCAAALYLLAPIFYETHTTGSHSWVAACFVMAAYFFSRMLRERRSIFAFAAGITIGISVSFHLTGALGVIPMTAILFYYRFKNEVSNPQMFYYLLGGLVAFAIWSAFEILPIGLDALLKKSLSGVAAQGEFIGRHWTKYFITGKRGRIIELPLFLVTLGSFKLFWTDLRTRFIYLFFVGLIIAYALLSGSGSLVTVWATLFVLVGGLISKLPSISISKWSFSERAWAGLLVLILLYYTAVQFKRIHTALWMAPVDQYTELTEKIADCIPEGRAVMGSPLYFLRFAGRNPYLAQNFYWQLMNDQTGELGDLQKQPVSVSVQKMVAFLKRRNVEYLIADEYFQEAIRPRIPEDQWSAIFTVVGELQSPIYGGSSTGGFPPYKIQIWRL